MNRGVEIVFGLVCWLTLTCGEAWAGEIVVIDQNGLERALKESASSAEVRVEMAQSAEKIKTARLESVDGFSSDHGGTVVNDNSVLFSNVGEGRWRVNVQPPRDIIAVEIKSK